MIKYSKLTPRKGHIYEELHKTNDHFSGYCSSAGRLHPRIHAARGYWPGRTSSHFYHICHGDTHSHRDLDPNRDPHPTDADLPRARGRRSTRQRGAKRQRAGPGSDPGSAGRRCALDAGRERNCGAGMAASVE